MYPLSTFRRELLGRVQISNIFVGNITAYFYLSASTRPHNRCQLACFEFTGYVFQHLLVTCNGPRKIVSVDNFVNKKSLKKVQSKYIDSQPLNDPSELSKTLDQLFLNTPSSAL